MLFFCFHAQRHTTHTQMHTHIMHTYLVSFHALHPSKHLSDVMYFCIYDENYIPHPDRNKNGCLYVQMFEEQNDANLGLFSSTKKGGSC